MKTTYFLNFHWFECTNFTNSNLFKYVSKIYGKPISEQHYWLFIERCIFRIFWIGGCKKFQHRRWRSSFEIPSIFDTILWKFHIRWFFTDLNAPTSKIQISSSMHPNFPTRILLKSICNSLSNGILTIIFGHVVVHIFIVEDGMSIIICWY